jgi:hypothetical protein
MAVMLLPSVSPDLVPVVIGLSVALLVVVQFERINKQRVLVAGVLVAVFLASVAVFADGGTVLNVCSGIDRDSWEWIWSGCWMLDMLG